MKTSQRLITIPYEGNPWSPLDSCHKGPVMRKIFPNHYIMLYQITEYNFNAEDNYEKTAGKDMERMSAYSVRYLNDGIPWWCIGVEQFLALMVICQRISRSPVDSLGKGP